MDKCWISSRCNGIDCGEPFCLKRFKLDKLFELSYIPEAFKKDVALRVDADKRDLDAFKYLQHVQQTIERFVNEGAHLYIHSETCGNGKTTWAVKILKEYLLRIWHKSDLTCKVLFIHVPRFLIALKDNISSKSEYVQYIKDNVMDADLVVFDEIGTKALSQFEFENILSIVNARIDSGKSNIYTSNLTNDEMLEKLGERLFSRIVHNSSDVHIVGRDKRGLFQ